jgi:hypothetical protein
MACGTSKQATAGVTVLTQLADHLPYIEGDGYNCNKC